MCAVRLREREGVASLNDKWIEFALNLMHNEPIALAGVQRIHRDVGLSIDPKIFFNPKGMTLESTGYTKAKLTMLQRNYYNAASIDRAKSDLRWRIDRKKYGSGAFDFRGIPKKNTKQDYCIQSCVISYYPRTGTAIQVFWRTAEIIKRLRGDFIFLRDFIFPLFGEELGDAPPFAIDFRFANVTFHPMFAILLLGRSSEWRSHLTIVSRNNDLLFHDILHWCWYYLLDRTCMVENYSSAAQVKRIAFKTITSARLKQISEYVEGEIRNDLDSFPSSVKRSFSRSRSRI